MNVLYSPHHGSTRYTYHTNKQNPGDSGKYLAGFANSEDEIKDSVRKSLGHTNFTVTAALTPNGALTSAGNNPN